MIHEPKPRIPKRILVLEWFVANHCDSMAGSHQPCGSIFDQAWPMVIAVGSDFLKAGCDVTIPVGGGLKEVARRVLPAGIDLVVSNPGKLPGLMATLGGEHDAVWVIAPETGRLLEDWTHWAENGPLALLSCPSRHVRLFSSKTATCDWLHKKKLPAPQGVRVSPGDDLLKLDRDVVKTMGWQHGRRVVVKPDDGFGGKGVAVFEDTHRACDYLRDRITGQPDRMGSTTAWRIEAYCPGMPASCGIIVGQGEPRVLPPTRQILDSAEVGGFRSSEWLGERGLEHRATRMAERVARHLVAGRGYYGIDMVLAPDPADDCVIEINPRLTASYPFVRAATEIRLVSTERITSR